MVWYALFYFTSNSSGKPTGSLNPGVGKKFLGIEENSRLSILLKFFRKTHRFPEPRGGEKILGYWFLSKGRRKSRQVLGTPGWGKNSWVLVFAKKAEKKSTGPRNPGVGKKFLGIGFCQKGGEKVDRSSEPGGGEKILGYWFLPKGRRKMGRSGVGKKFLGIGFCQKGGEKWVGRGWGKISWVLVFAKRAEKNGSVGGGEKILGPPL